MFKMIHRSRETLQTKKKRTKLNQFIIIIIIKAFPRIEDMPILYYAEKRIRLYNNQENSRQTNKCLAFYLNARM